MNREQIKKLKKNTEKNPVKNGGSSGGKKRKQEEKIVEIGNKYTTFFFEEYEKMAEKKYFFQLFFQVKTRVCGVCRGDNLKKIWLNGSRKNSGGIFKK